MLRMIPNLMVLIVFLAPTACFSQAISDYLLLEDIGMYKILKPEKLIPGFPPTGDPSSSQWSGIVAATGHFQDHQDTTYEVMYLGGDSNLASPTVQVTQHSGGDSDQWLSHEIEDGYRDGEYNSLGLATEGSVVRDLKNNKILWIGMGGGDFLWLHNNIAIKISYTDLNGTKPEPLEVVQAYLQKYPSTIPATLVLDKAHDEQWIKDEMDRRIWLGDKWFSWQTAGNAQIPDTLDEINDHLGTFLDYREKYYGIKADSEKETLYQLVPSQNLQGMKDKLTEYKTWWTANKSGSINLP